MPGVNTARGRLWIADHRRGRGRPVTLFIHGAGGSHLSFPAALRQLHTVSPILVDLPGHGASAGPGRRNISDYALDLVALLDALAIDSAIVLGHSMGGAIAQWLALEHKTRISAVILAGTGARLPVNPALISGVVEDPAATINSIVRWMWSQDAPAELKRQTTEIMLATDPFVVRDDFIACDNFDVSRRLAEIETPTYILAGENDKMTPPSLSQELARSIVNAELEILPNAGHMTLLEQPDFSADLVAKWLKRALI